MTEHADTPAEVATLCERIADALKATPDHDTARQALVAVLGRWLAIAALGDGGTMLDLGRHYARAAVELHLSSQGAFARMGDGWRQRN